MKRCRWLSSSPTGEVSTRQVSELTSDVGSSVKPVISVTTRADPNGVFVTATLAATIVPVMNTHSCVDRQPLRHRPTRGRTRLKNNGMMNPPRQPVTRAIAAPSNLHDAGDDEDAHRRGGWSSIVSIWNSPFVSAYGVTSASRPSAMPPSIGRGAAGTSRIRRWSDADDDRERHADRRAEDAGEHGPRQVDAVDRSMTGRVQIGSSPSPPAAVDTA